MPRPVHIVDVFAHEPYAGNPLAVVLDADGLSADAMQKIAAEMNFSETTFVGNAPGGDGGWPVRIYTPAREIASPSRKSRAPRRRRVALCGALPTRRHGHLVGRCCWSIAFAIDEPFGLSAWGPRWRRVRGVAAAVAWWRRR
ncbi:MAG: PhzF family phenazine biosynthesis protein, partial [Burkholderiales bacterium]|nr:PhzF family phenazine biosynthesis protein [Burkholderiales bacterium]